MIERMQAQASVFGAAELSRAADLVNQGLTEMRGATSPRLQLELICARVLLPAAFDDERSYGPGSTGSSAGGRGALAGGVAAGVPAGGAVGTYPGRRRTLRWWSRRGAVRRGRGPCRGVGHRRADRRRPARPRGPGPRRPGAGRSRARTTARGPRRLPPRRLADGRDPRPAAPRAAATPQAGAWPTAAASPAASTSALTPASAPQTGAWPTAATPAPAQTPAAPAAGPGSGGPQGDATQARQLWPNILEAVKNRRRFTWILLSQNAQVAGCDGTTLQVGFSNAGARDSFANSGSEDVLRQALGDLGLPWKTELLVDPSAAATRPAEEPRPGWRLRRRYGGGFGGGAPAAPPAAPAYARPQTPAPAPAPQQAPPAPPRRPARRSRAPAAGPSQQYRQPEPPPVPIEDDVPAEDDPDLDDTALTGHDLIVRELGATVIEEIANE
ncbi:hypothetical protein [Streptomyces cinnamoneus]|uniref:hypothetical protein n=1 Tax=Streptomyces cinnamoneus TaxID=53446 RepID=UPI003B969EC9